jgi:N-acetylneuraminic acid mutarotase
MPDAPPPPWTQPLVLEERTLEPGVTVLGDRLVVMGGFDTSLQEGLAISRKVHRLDTVTDTWAELPDAPVAWTHIDLLGVGGSLYLLGGLEGQQYTASGEAFVLDPGGSVWRQLASQPAGLERGAAGLVINGSHLLLLGGASTADAVATCLDYDLSNDVWTQLPDLPAKRSHPAAMRMGDGTLIVAGGLGTLDASEPHAEVFALAPGASAWTTGRAPMKTPRGGCSYGVLDGQLICAGGEAGASALHVVESYDPIDDAWSDLPNLPDERAGTQGAVIARHFYLPGGARELQFVPLDTLLVYAPEP